MKLYTAVLAAINNKRQAKSNFSAYDITSEIRSACNSGQLFLSDKTSESIGGMQTYRIDNDEVKGLIYEAFGAGILDNYPRHQLATSGTHREFVYEDNASSQPQIPTPTNPNRIGGAYSPAGSSPTATVIASQAIGGSAAANVKSYLDNSSSPRTLKEIQSAGKRYLPKGTTCKDLASIVTQLGYKVMACSHAPSLSVVTL